MHPTDHIQIVLFRLTGVSHDDYVAHTEAVAPEFTRIPGLRAKAWLADARTNCYGGVYAWESREAMEAYIHGPVFAGLRENRGIADVMTHSYDVLQTPTRITQRRQQLSLAPRDAWAAA